MRKFSPSSVALFFFLSCWTSSLQGETETDDRSTSSKVETHKQSPNTHTKSDPLITHPIVVVQFHPFTGRITKNKVRMRLQSAYDGSILREFNRNDLVVVLGETDDFYAVQPPSDFKAYVSRKYVLDNVVEGTRVNVRLKPELDSPIVAQLDSGQRIEGTIHPASNKWLEIKLPDTVRFYIAKEYIEKAGDVNYKARLEKKQNEAYQLLNTTASVSQSEMQKPFEQINIEGIKFTYQNLILDYPEFPELGLKAKEKLAALQEAYTSKKLAHLEHLSHASSSTIETNKKLSAELNAQKAKITHLEQQIEKNHQFTTIAQPIVVSQPPPARKQHLPINMSLWLPLEQSLFNAWSQQTGNHNPKDFYEEQKQQGFVLRGVIDPYTRPVKNKPGDYMLINTASKLPIAFLYSTHINLQDYIGHEVSIVVAPRVNNNFAFPAYFVLTLE
jgi:uncharacterized protein YgiM (DUF1202 family)